jgi:branched-chain amino acid transport system permease protein
MSRGRMVNIGGLVLLVVVAAALPYIGGSSYVISLVTTILIGGILASSLNFLVADGGMASLGHGAIAAASAYGAAWASKAGYDTATQALIALGVTVLVSFMYGVLSMRTSGIYFLMVTLALGMVVYGLAFRLSAVTGGENGISGIARPEFIFEYWTYYYFVLGAFIFTTVLLWVVSRSPFGASLRGIRDSETRMRSLGYTVPAYRLGAFMISGTVAGFAGLLSVWLTHFVSPSSAGVHRSVLLIVMVILGGVGTVLGPLIGAAVVVLVENVLSNTVERWPTVLGLIFILVILFARAGIVGTIGKAVDRIKRRGSRPPEPPARPEPPGDLVSPSGAPVSERNHID